jgi:hypothetical protein
MADEAKPGDEGAGAEPQLPMVVSPRLDGSEAEGPDSGEATGAASDEAAGSESLSRSLRFTLLAASVAAMAALGSFVGSLSASGVGHLWSGEAASVKVAVAAPQPVNKAELAELSALKATLDGATKGTNGQFAKLADRLDRVERVQIESATKLAHVADAMDQLEKKAVVASAAPVAPAQPAAAAPETTGSIANRQAAADPEARLSDKVLRDWIVQDVRGGHALVESRFGAIFDVAAGGTIPGLGRVESIKRQDGLWIVATARGLITSLP